MSGWTFLTNHAQVFLCVAQDRRATTRTIAAKVGITERAVQRILDDLEQGGYITRQREGRSNHYELHPERPMRHPAQQGHQVGKLPPSRSHTALGAVASVDWLGVANTEGIP